MTLPAGILPVRQDSYGASGVSLVDRFGVALSRRAIERALGARQGLTALDFGCGYHATLLRALAPRLDHGVGIDVRIAPELKESGRLRFIEASIDRLGELRALLRPGMGLEVAAVRWLPLDEAPRLLAYGGERQMAERAREALDG